MPSAIAMEIRSLIFPPNSRQRKIANGIKKSQREWVLGRRLAVWWWATGDLSPGVPCARRFVDDLKQFACGVIVFPAAAIAKVADVGQSALRQRQPFAGDSVEGTWSPF
jgi:hypothetical protein